ncbi:VCBS repeat-containing protein [Streptomyces sp. G45]|uniref:VCBS repeat-containing protein n=1 Tax=Streptomyces sp. G45 TaxID=3406627 RepID=UPI003C1A8637
MAALTLSVNVPSAGAAPACTAGTESDFNGDGIRDTAVADAEATVDGKVGAGLVRVVLGGGKGVAELSQQLSDMTANPEAGDKFGSSIAVYDADQDGCADLVVGTPYEDVTTAAGPQEDAGAVYVIHGRPAGIGEGSVIDSYTQAGLDGSTVTEAGDLFGVAVAAGTTSHGKPFLAVGVPGEDIGTAQDAGSVHYVQGTTKSTVSQDDPGVPGVVEAHDRFGYALAATDRYLTVGAPGEAIAAESGAGAVALFRHTLDNGRPAVVDGLDENHSALVSGTSEKGDRFGTSLSMVAYRPAGTESEKDALLAIGTPNEDVSDVTDAGAVTVVHVKENGTVSEVNLIDRLSPQVERTPW